MDPPLDPRLQASSNQPNDLSSGTSKLPKSYPDPSSQSSTSAQPDNAATASPQQSRQAHQFYGVTTASSYSPDNSGGAQQTYPYTSSISTFGARLQQSPDYGASLPTVAEVAADLKRARACEACRQLKVKCEPDDVVSDTCRRCFRSGRQCVVTMPTRKRQKKTDSRVTELEKKIDALTASLQAQQTHGQNQVRPDPSSDSAAQLQLTALEDARATLYAEQHVGQWTSPKKSTGNNFGRSEVVDSLNSLKRKHSDVEDDAEKASPGPGPNMMLSLRDVYPSKSTHTQDDYTDMIDRQMLDAETAYQCFDRYVNEMAPTIPLVVFPPGTRAENVRKGRPLLFLAIVSVASNSIRPDVYPSLVNEALRVYADRTVCRGEKSIDIVQALLVSTLWYAPPERYEELNFNQLIHMAAVMAIDLGMGKRMKAGNRGVYKDFAEKKAILRADPDTPETRRTWLGCYFMCANAAMSLRRPLLIRWTGYMDDSLEILENSQDALPSDKWLACLIRAQHIAEEVGFQFSMDDPTVEVSIAEPKVQYHLKAFERQLSEWRNKIPNTMHHAIFSHMSHITSLYIHEIAMHQGHNIDDFRPPFTVSADSARSDSDAITPAHIDSFTICIQSIHGAFDALLSVDKDQLRSLPTLSFVRTSYAIVALIKLSCAFSSPGTRLGEVFKLEDLKTDQYVDALVSHLRQAAEGDRCRVASKFAIIFAMLLTWHQQLGEPKVNQSIPNSVAKESSDSVNGTLGNQTSRQDPISTQWSKRVKASTTGRTSGQTGPSGLEMLSEVASSSNNPAMGSTLDSSGSTVPNGVGTWPQQYGGFSGRPTNSYFGTIGGVDMDILGFNADDFAPYLNDPEWMLLPLEQSSAYSFQ